MENTIDAAGVQCCTTDQKMCAALMQLVEGTSSRAALRMEAVCDDYLYCWHLGFGIPGARNDLNILYASTLFRSIRHGSWPPLRPQTTIAGLSLSWFYYLTDSVYPDWRVFVKTLKHPKNRKEKNFGKQQEAVRKAIERFFGVLFRKYRMLRNPFSLWYTHDMANIMEACVIVHNMTVPERKAQYTGTRKARVATDAAESEGAGATTYHALEPPADYYQRVNWLHDISGEVESREHHAQLHNALVEHMYSRAGDAAVDESSEDEFEL